MVYARVESDAVRNWLFATENGETSCELEPRSGGIYKITGIENRRRNVAVCEYLPVDPPGNLRFTLGMLRAAPEFDTSTVEFSPSGGGTELSFAQNGLRLEYLKATPPVWRGMFGVL